MINGEAWVRKDNKEWFSTRVVFVKKKDCKNDKCNFENIIKEDDEEMKINSDIQECYMRYFPRGKEESQFEEGEPCWCACAKGRGATAFYFAEVI